MSQANSLHGSWWDTRTPAADGNASQGPSSGRRTEDGDLDGRTTVRYTTCRGCRWPQLISTSTSTTYKMVARPRNCLRSEILQASGSHNYLASDCDFETITNSPFSMYAGHLPDINSVSRAQRSSSSSSFVGSFLHTSTSFIVVFHSRVRSRKIASDEVNRPAEIVESPHLIQG